MSTSAEPNPKQSELSSQSNQAMPATNELTIDKVKSWTPDELLEWIQQELSRPLKTDDETKLLDADVDGEAFLGLAGDRDYFKSLGLSPGASQKLSQLAKNLAELSGTTFKRERLANFDPYQESRQASRTKQQLEQSEEYAEADFPPRKRKLAPYKQEEAVVSQWNEFYDRARALHNEIPDRASFSKNDQANVEKIFQMIEKEEYYNFPKDGDPTLVAACEDLNSALQNAIKANVEQDTAEIKNALDNLQKVYDKASKSNAVLIRYIDVVPPCAPFSPLDDNYLKRIIMARPWMRELITKIHDQSLDDRTLVIGNLGSGKSVALVGYLLFHLIAIGERVILQSEQRGWSLGYIFDNYGVHELFPHNAPNYADGKPCYLLVSADGTLVYPLRNFSFCNKIIVVTSPNMNTKGNLKNWAKQTLAEYLIAPLPSCSEVVYLLSKTENYNSYLVYWMYQQWSRDFRRCKANCKRAISYLEKETFFKCYKKLTRHIKDLARKMLSGQELNTVNVISDRETSLIVPSRLVTMERYPETTDEYDIIFMTPHIAEIVSDVQEEKIWARSCETLGIYFRNPETRVAAGKRFQRMFLDKFKRQDPNTMPPCYRLGVNGGMHPLSPLASDAVTAMPWKGLGQQPKLEYISIGTDAKGELYSRAELQAVIEAAIDKDSPPIRFIIPCAQNWASWDAAVVYSEEEVEEEEEKERAIHVIFLQLTTYSEHEIYAKGLNQVRDVLPEQWKRDKGFDVYYHYVLVLLIQDEDRSQIPTWKRVLNNSKDRKKDETWHPDNLQQYVMFVPMKELFKPLSKD